MRLAEDEIYRRLVRYRDLQSRCWEWDGPPGALVPVAFWTPEQLEAEVARYEAELRRVR